MSAVALEVSTASLRLHLSVLPAVSRGSQRRGSRRVLLLVDAAGLRGRHDDVATAEQVDDLERWLQAWSTGRDATLVLPAQRVLELRRRDGRVQGVLTLAHDPATVTLQFDVLAPAVVVEPL